MPKKTLPRRFTGSNNNRPILKTKAKRLPTLRRKLTWADLGRDFISVSLSSYTHHLALYSAHRGP